MINRLSICVFCIIMCIYDKGIGLDMNATTTTTKKIKKNIISVFLNLF